MRGNGPSTSARLEMKGEPGRIHFVVPWLRMLLIVGVMAILSSLVFACRPGEGLVTERILVDAERRRERDRIPVSSSTPTVVPATATSVPTRTPHPGRALANVIRVWDGNTVLLEGGNSVRYIGVNTPGAGMFGRPLEPFGREAAERNVELVEGKQVEIEADTSDVDPAGLLLRYVYAEGQMINEVLLREGLARLAPANRNVAYLSSLQLAEAEARQTPVNIWTLATLTRAPTRTPTETPIPSATRPPTATLALQLPQGPLTTAIRPTRGPTVP